MSKIGMRSIAIKRASVGLEGDVLKIQCDSKTVKHQIPQNVKVVVENSQIKVSLKDGAELNRENKCVWGLTRALIASELKGLEDGFTYTIRLVGLSCKAALVGEKVVFTLGYSHKIEVPLDKNISVEIDKNGQLMTLKSSDKFALGNYCSHIRSLRPPEPYKGTGIFVNDEKILRKAGKSK